MKIATGDQVSVAELKAKLGIEDGDIYLSVLEQPLYMESKLHRVTVEMVTKDEKGELLGAVRGTDDDGNQTFMNVLFDPGHADMETEQTDGRYDWRVRTARRKVESGRRIWWDASDWIDRRVTCMSSLTTSKRIRLSSTEPH